MPPGTALLAPRRPAFTTVTEIRATDLRFTLNEARTLFAAAGVELAGPVLPRLVDRTEGWAAGLRLAALSLAERPDPESLADEFSGSERTVAQYLLAEALDRPPEAVRRLLLRTPSGRASIEADSHAFRALPVSVPEGDPVPYEAPPGELLAITHSTFLAAYLLEALVIAGTLARSSSSTARAPSTARRATVS